MYLLILAIPVTWTLVLTIYLLKNPRTLAGLLRWTLWTYLFVFAMLISEVVREGLKVQAAVDANTNSSRGNGHVFVVGDVGGSNSGGSLPDLYNAGMDHQEVVQDVGFWWFLWALLIVSGALTPWALVPATALPVVLLSHPPFRVLINYGLARLGWTAAVYNPVLWAAAHLGSLLWTSWRTVLSVVVKGDWAAWIIDKVVASGGGPDKV
ncbi:hypothetical protein PFICI_10362 [Pestalotiopsis fici W106-1]|uniref:Uncharacterized protein n=1 Tax=Pestalotiopsis fici (strain W106-1 / CGMCC3.15140) TaxID=1229662 RepID=W3WWS7_PESFW|nr:uncharacterized protein PFICI_10362 [Pestalotiopsis fici W106-1]ETS78300.1 hypothetical protein PFICI_10362 [Pestalotiopsis fici W106-1]